MGTNFFWINRHVHEQSDDGYPRDDEEEKETQARKVNMYVKK